MVDSVTASAPYYSYLNQIQGVQNTSHPASTSPTQVTPATSSSSSNNNSSSTSGNSASDAVNTLLGGNSFAPEILSLLQNNSSGNFDPVSSLLNGGTSTNNAVTSLFSNIYNTALSAAVTKAKNSATSTATPSTNAPPTGSKLVDNLISQITQASIAYNTTIQQNAQNAINSYATGSIPPITT